MTKGQPRDRILARVRSAKTTGPSAAHRGRVDHPGGFVTPESDDPIGTFRTRLEGSGGEVVELAPQAFPEWLSALVADSTVAFAPGAEVDGFRTTAAQDADYGVVRALRGIAETGSLLLTSVEGRRVQLLPRTLVVLLPRNLVVSRLADALTEIKTRLPGALGLHSGPSKSADIGQTVVTGVHGPGRLIAVIIDE